MIKPLNPDGVEIQIPWNKLEVGSSVFIPCINNKKASRAALKIARELKITIKHSVVIEKEKLGIRIWRTL